MQTETKTPDKKEKKTLAAEILDWVKTIAIALAIAFVIRTFVIGFVHVSGDSMLETLKNGDVMLVTMYDRFIGDYERGEVVICNYPNAKGYRVKRVVGMPGERVSCTGCHEDNRTSVATGRKQADLKPIQEIVPGWRVWQALRF